MSGRNVEPLRSTGLIVDGARVWLGRRKSLEGKGTIGTVYGAEDL